MSSQIIYIFFLVILLCLTTSTLVRSKEDTCYCTCVDGSKCIRISKFLRILPVCGCDKGVCPVERVYKGSQSCGISHYIPLFMRPFFVPTVGTPSLNSFMKQIRFEFFSGERRRR
eukprot:TRINITY_DN84_c0_g1_i1.p1 TRINITY_DN84_c0_g1~~TRINITY_DN84_c0_g1_i1.p1  ORF type:complete len:115 (-),score=4.00 TRINITY_DN84_c0_g1_i1:109-453(-)